ncbi:alanine tRS [Acrasis kona]|uniref:Alanine tRS n=1 Tax=Acrasis kona TaxID=1008807 RepID=A0AAW2Z275_9EUKA
MTRTEHAYLNDTFLFEHNGSKVVNVSRSENEPKQSVVLLNSTIFHPQGGGQPSDVGIISDGQTTFKVLKAIKSGEQVQHLGTFEPEDSTFEENAIVHQTVDKDSRLQNASLHSAGHLIDFAVKLIGFDKWTSSKGYHFPQSPYVEYNHNGQYTKESEIVETLNVELDKLLKKNENVKVEMVPYDKWTEIPSYLPAGEPVRTINYGGICGACSGTHVNTFGQIGSKITIKSAKKKGAVVRVSYKVE